MNNPKKILLAEDNPDDEALTLRALEKCGVYNKVDVVHDGQEAVDYLHHEGEFRNLPEDELPQLILLDLKLPKLDGLEVLQQIRDSEKFPYIPVVILTSSREESDLIAGYESGANSFVCKPVNFGEFSEVVRRLGFYWLLVNERPESS